MRALTVRQPWASLIIRGGKDIENRDWPTTQRGIVAIHSSAKLHRSDMEDACDFMRSFIPRFSAERFRADNVPPGVILGTVEIVGCVLASTSPWFCGGYGFVLRNATAFAKPIPCRGALGFWEVPTNLMELMRSEYRYSLAQGRQEPTAAGKEKEAAAEAALAEARKDKCQVK
jgi:hypothetical protein